MTRILLVDDHPVMRQGIKQVLSGAFHPAEVGEAATAEEGMSEVRSTEWDVMVLDLTLPGVSGLDLLKDLRRERPTLPVLILSMHPPDQFARRAMNAGASGYLTKDSAAAQLVGALRKIAAGGVHISEAAAASLVSGGRQPHETLSDREFQVLRLLVEGLGPTEIAERLHLSVKTVSTHKTRILDKLGLGSTAELVRYALENKLL